MFTMIKYEVKLSVVGHKEFLNIFKQVTLTKNSTKQF